MQICVKTTVSDLQTCRLQLDRWNCCKLAPLNLCCIYEYANFLKRVASILYEYYMKTAVPGVMMFNAAFYVLSV